MFTCLIENTPEVHFFTQLYINWILFINNTNDCVFLYQFDEVSSVKMLFKTVESTLNMKTYVIWFIFVRKKVCQKLMNFSRFTRNIIKHLIPSIYSQLTNINYLRSSIILFPFITFSFFLRTFFLQCGYVCVCVCVYVRYVSMQHLIYYHNIDSNKWFYLKNWGYLYEIHLLCMKKRIFMQIHECTHT